MKQREQYIQNTKSLIKGTVLEIVAEKGTVANPGVPLLRLEIWINCISR